MVELNGSWQGRTLRMLIKFPENCGIPCGISGPIGNKSLNLKADFSISYLYPRDQIGISCLGLGGINNFNHHYNWENVYF